YNHSGQHHRGDARKREPHRARLAATVLAARRCRINVHCLMRGGPCRATGDSEMADRVTSSLSWPSLFRMLVAHLGLTVRLLREPLVPRLIKAVPVLAVLYVMLPLDFVPDFLPVLGQLDDLGVLLLAVEGFTRLCPKEA